MQPSTSTSGGSREMLIGLGVLGFGVVVGGAYLIGRPEIGTPAPGGIVEAYRAVATRRERVNVSEQ